MKHKKKTLWGLAGLFLITAMPGTAVAPPSLNGAIIVFTGNEDRVAKGLRMYMSGTASRMFITGNDNMRDMHALLADYKIPLTRSLAGITFDRVARDTVENAKNASGWMTRQNIQHAYLVTSDFHMNRSLRLLRDEVNNKALITACPLKTETDESIVAGENLKYAVVSWVPNITLDMPRAWRAKISSGIVYASGLLPAYKAPPTNAGPC